MTAKTRTDLYLSRETETALREYTRHHRDRFPTTSRAAEHLLTRALMSPMDEGREALLVPHLARAVRAIVREEVIAQMHTLLERQSHRLATLLVQSGNDAYRAARLAEVALGHLLSDPARAARVAEEARGAAGARYREKGRDEGGGSGPPPGSASRPPGGQR